jgi:16S rRNA G966 N2-methylase RsmD
MSNALYYGDNFDILRRHVDTESVDLIYLDPPFQSGRDYNILFEEQVQKQLLKSRHSKILGNGIRERPNLSIMSCALEVH